MSKHILFAIAVLCASAAMSALAQQPGVDAQLQARIVVKQADGKETFRAADKARPGDVVDYRVTYANATKTNVSHVMATLPIPADSMVLLAGSAVPANALVSVDGKQFAAPPLRRNVTLPDGRVEARAIPVSEYRFLRWDLGTIAAGQAKVVSARMRVVDGTESAPVDGAQQ
jgi:hypothetical protein